jgi:hypothetical protein
MSKKKTAEEISKELEAERATIKVMQATLAKAQKEKVTAEAAQDESAYDAIAKGDEKAQKKLDAAEDVLTKAERRMQSIEKAISKAMQKFEALEAERERAWRCEALEAWKALARKRIELAPRVDKVVNELIDVHAEFKRITEAMRPIRQGLNLSPAPKLAEDNLHEYLRYRLFPHFNKFVLDKTFRVYERGSMAELEAAFFERLLAMDDVPDGGGPGAEATGNGQDGPLQQAEPEAQAEGGTAAQA